MPTKIKQQMIPAVVKHEAAMNNSSNKVVKSYPNLFGNGINLSLYHSSIIDCESSIQALVNCTGPHFEAHGK